MNPLLSRVSLSSFCSRSSSASSIWVLVALRARPRELRDPDLVIRTSGEQRISNFLLWQSAYAELVFDDTLWPDFGEERLQAAVDEYARRGRRFGAR